ncbi:sensor histidine kinase [Devosia sp. 1566]|uniref:sensor histidine kinase n=1 Tax=Devosia sp. 1566 TaxID=2499144 RepID=UPI000FDAB0BB|nr:sensor histidine kinase [Devosia sp. 1566]
MHNRSEVVHVLAPLGRDAQSVCSILATRKFETNVVHSLNELAEALGDDTGAVVLTEDAMVGRDWSVLVKALEDQPSWSSYPFIFIIGRRNAELSPNAAHALLPPELSNVMMLEKPMGSATLLSAVAWALGGRRRQFQTRDHLRELEQSAARQRLMTRELAHRVKNTIAVLQSIVSQTMRPFPEMGPVKDRLVERFAALARAHDLLLTTDFHSAMFRQLVVASVSVHDGDGTHFTLDGPDFEISPQAALSFALVFHELATNAVKYGALSTGAGHVRVSWEVTSGEQLELTWREQGGPPVAEPAVKGFGSRLIRTTLAGLGQVTVAYLPDGLDVRFVGPMAGLTYSVVPDFVAEAL